MKLCARNRLKGKIVEVKKGATTCHVKIDVGGTIVTSSITNEAAEELKLAAGHDRLCGHQGERRHGRRRLSRLPRNSGSTEGLSKAPAYATVSLYPIGYNETGNGLVVEPPAFQSL